MRADSQRVGQYTKAIAKSVPGKRVLDIGTGRDALLAQLCVHAGAAHVTAMEVVPETAEQARELVARAGLADRIRVLEGHSGRVSLPGADMIVHEIVGSLALEEGMASVILDMQQRPQVVDSTVPGWSLPRYVETRVVPLAHGGVLHASQVGRKPVDFEAASGGDEDAWVRLSIDRLVRIPAPPAHALLGRQQVLDSLDTMQPAGPQLQQSGTLEWVVESSAMLAGFACAPFVDLDGESVIDAWLGGTSWPHKVAALAAPVSVAKGDRVVLKWSGDFARFPTSYGFSAWWRRP